ncbi:MAG: hypothetical protein GX454_04195, partial [Brooklawnia sp.]|nr:hypothetical protein [Brooklawnia sp.]
MTEVANEPVRQGLLARAALDVLDEAGAAVPRSEVLRRVAERVSLTPYELDPPRPGSHGRRWEKHLSWASTEMRAAGWIDKSAAGWAITDEGRRVLQESTSDGLGLAARAAAAYRRHSKARKAADAGPSHTRILEAALEFLEPGQWTSYSDLAAVAGTTVQSVGSVMNATTVEGAHRVLSNDGRPVPGFRWADGRSGLQRDALEAEGVTFNADNAASEAQHVRTEDLREFLEEQGLLTPPPRRAWLVRGSSVDGHDLIPSWRNQGFASLRASKLREVEPGISRDELKAIVNDDYSQTSYAAKAAKVDEFHAFLARMQVDDLIATTSQGQLFAGKITGPAEYVKSPDGLSNLRRDVAWASEGVDYAELPGEVKARLQIQYDVVEMTQQLEVLEKLLVTQQDNVAPAAAVPVLEVQLVLPDASDDLASSLHVEREWLQECVDLLRDRPQLIFYGPPGTGKTYIAQHLAHH